MIMSTRIRINITKDVLRRSANCDSFIFGDLDNLGGVGSNCAVALAIWDVIPYVWVNSHNIGFYENGEDLETNDRGYANCPLPLAAQRFILHFDRLYAEERVNMWPISFEINVPDTVISKISIDEITKLVERQKEKTVELV